jgi:hypothetical protein
MRRHHLELELGDQPGQAWRLPFRQVEHHASEGCGVDDRMLQGTFKAATDEPGIERVVTVLDEHGAVGETKECPSNVPELGGADQHRAVNLMAFARIRIDRRAAVDQGVEEGERAIEREAFGADLEDKEWRVAGGLDVEGDKLSVIKLSFRPYLRRVDGNLFPRHQLN